MFSVCGFDKLSKEVEKLTRKSFSNFAAAAVVLFESERERREEEREERRGEGERNPNSETGKKKKTKKTKKTKKKKGKEEKKLAPPTTLIKSEGHQLFNVGKRGALRLSPTTMKHLQIDDYYGIG